MKILLLLAAVLVCAAAANDDSKIENWIDYRLVSKYEEPTPPAVQCATPGPVCGDCKNLYLCDNSTGEWDVSWLWQCEGTQTCNLGQCTATPNSECALEGKEFKCVSLQGMYPDPGVCTKFHYCVPEGNGVKKIESSCGDNSKHGYNLRTTYCDIPLVNNKCGQSSIPICKTPGQTGALKENPTMYYICKPYETGQNVLYPFLHTCPNGRSYNGNLGCK